MLVEIRYLRDLSLFEKLLEMVNFRANSIVIVSQLVSSALQVFCLLAQVLVNLGVLLRVVAHAFSEFSCFTSVINFNITSESLEFINIFRPIVSFHR